MTDFTRRTLRTWAVLDGLHALLIGLCAAFIVPWKTPWANALLLAYAALYATAGAGLWRLARWGWRLGVAAGLAGLATGVIVVGGLVASWAYLRGIYGDFGHGASIAALLIAVAAFSVLGLFPALQLRALLRREVRGDVGAGKAASRAVVAAVALPALLAVAAAWYAHLPTLDPVPDAGRAQAIQALRAALVDKPRPATPDLVGVPVGAGPLYVTLWDRGEVFVRVTGEGDDLAAAVADAADALQAHARGLGRKLGGGRLRVDRLVGTGRVLAPLLALSVDPGLDGLRRAADGAERVLLPDDLVRRDRFGHAPLVPGIRELRLGLDAAWAHERLGGADGIERLRTEGWVEHGATALPVSRGNTPGPAPTADALRASAIRGGDFILRQIQKDGRFHYQYFALDDRPGRGGEYSIPRHAGTVYSLALLYRLTGEQRFKDGAEKAAAWLVERIPESCGAPGRSCVEENGRAWLGSAALTLVGMFEYQRSTGDARYAEPARRLTEFVLSMQRPDGEFHHLLDLKTGRVNEQERSMFYSEEAALALVMAHQALGDDRYLQAARRALDYLTGPKYDFFLGRFIYGADHWTCIAAEEAWPRLKERQYLDFCLDYARFLRRMQYDRDWEDADWAGHYGFSGLMVPQAPAAAGFSEATISTWLLAKNHGVEAEDVRDQTLLALEALLRDQMRDDNAWLAKNRAKALGGFRRSTVQQEVRIDFTQHAASAIIRGIALLDPPT